MKGLMQWFNLEPVTGIRKTPNGPIVSLKNAVIMGLQRDGIFEVIVDGSRWLCCDEESRWWVLNHQEYMSLGPNKHVILFPNEDTWKQVMAIQAIEKLKKDFESMSLAEQLELYKMYPELFTKR